MEEMTKRNWKGVWTCEIKKVLRLFAASIEWLMEQIGLYEEEMKKTGGDDETTEYEKIRS